MLDHCTKCTSVLNVEWHFTAVVTQGLLPSQPFACSHWMVLIPFGDASWRNISQGSGGRVLMSSSIYSGTWTSHTSKIDFSSFPLKSELICSFSRFQLIEGLFQVYGNCNFHKIIYLKRASHFSQLVFPIYQKFSQVIRSLLHKGTSW